MAQLSSRNEQCGATFVSRQLDRSNQQTSGAHGQAAAAAAGSHDLRTEERQMMLRLTTFVLSGLFMTACAAGMGDVQEPQGDRQSIYDCDSDVASATRQVIASSASEAKRLCLSPAGGA
jgi:hypothetical protein